MARSANSIHGPNARHDRVRGHCNGTRYVVRQVSRRYIDAEIVCCSSHGPLSPTSLLTDSCTWRRRDEERVGKCESGRESVEEG